MTALAHAPSRASELRMRPPRPSDGPDLAALVARCEGLDPNSAYAYVVLCDEFRDTCVVARDHDDRLRGFVTGFRSPRDPSRLFLWQIGVDPDYRGRGLAHALLRRFVDVGARPGVTTLETTIAPDNTASRALFTTFARSLGSELMLAGRIPAEWLGGGHPDEDRYRIDLRRARPGA